MKRLTVFFALFIALAAWAGHELPIYPSFYPHEIEIRTIAPEQAAIALRDGKLHAYVGPGLSVAGAAPGQIGAIESLGAFVVVRINPQSKAKDDACATANTVMRALGTGQGEFVLHPYPVTPLHGDYLYHADLAEAARARRADGEAVPGLKVKANGALARPGWSAQGDDWDAEVLEVDAAGLVASAMGMTNGLIAPPWLKAGWFHAERLLADAAGDPALQRRGEADRTRLIAGNYSGLTERINIERNLVSALIGDCRKIVAGYTVKRESINIDYSTGIENVGYDALSGLSSPMFLRTVKLKDFPWNGWLALGTPAPPAAAWNPIGGMTDPFGRLVGYAVTDPALLPAPYEAGWMLNRIADLPSNAGR